MSFRQVNAKMQVGDTPLVVDHRYQANYLKALALQNGQKFKQSKQPNGAFKLWCIGHMKGASSKEFLDALRAQREAKRQWRERNRERYECQLLTRKFLRAGIVARQPCEICGNARTYAFHADYAKPDEVVWLCHQHLLEFNRRPRASL